MSDRSSVPPDGNQPLPPPGVRELARSSPEKAATYIRRLIFERVLLPGTKVPQDQIAAALGVSRVPVREALVVLEKEGRVRLVHNRGAFVASVSEQSVRDLVEVGDLVIGFTLKRAIERQTPEFVAEVSGIRDAIDSTDDPVELHVLFDTMQKRLAEFGVGGRIAHFLSDLRAFQPDTLFDQLEPLVADLKEVANAVADAVAARDPDAAADSFTTWHNRLRDQILSVYRSDGIIEPSTPEGRVEGG